MSIRKEDLIAGQIFSRPLMLHPELDAGQYQEGQRMGTEALDLPAASDASLRRGYIEGLRTFLAGKNVDPKSLHGVYTSPENLVFDSVVAGYSRGIKRQPPNFQRDFRIRDSKYQENLNYVSVWLADLQARTMQERDGFALGFVVGVIKDFGVTLHSLEIPGDDPSFRAFINGLTAEPRAIGETRKRSSRDKYLFEKMDPFFAQVEGYARKDDQMYHAGLRVWIHSLGLRIDTWQLRHPEALRTFKAALQGEVLSEYEPQEQRWPAGKGTDLNNLINHRFEEKKSLKKTLLDEESDPHEIARSWGRSGYKLGSAARHSFYNQGHLKISS